MTWRLLTSFSLLLVFASATTAGTLSGTVALTPDKRKDRDLSGIIIWLEPLNGPRTQVPARNQGRVQMLQKGKRFVPHILPLLVGTTVDFPNLDPIFHNAFSNFHGKIFDVGLYPPGTNRAVRFDRPGVVRIFCNIHSAMSAILVVLDTPYFAASNRDGRYTIPDVPPGEYRLRAYHERATQVTLDALTRTLQVSGEAMELPPIAVSEEGYMLMPHTNKFGKAYPLVEENPLYPGAR